MSKYEGPSIVVRGDIRDKVKAAFPDQHDHIAEFNWKFETNKEVPKFWWTTLTVVFFNIAGDGTESYDRSNRLQDAVWGLAGTKGPWIDSSDCAEWEAKVMFNIPKGKEALFPVEGPFVHFNTHQRGPRIFWLRGGRPWF